MKTCLCALAFLVCGNLTVRADGGCSCDVARMKGGWCGECEVGYVASVKIESADLFEWLDAHGHKIDPKRIACSSCKKALASDGYCEKCLIGYVHKEAYLSRLTYHLAKGAPKKIERIACTTCRKNAAKYGWCDRCEMGMVGNVALNSKDDFAHASKALQRLLDAIEVSKKCEMCGVAMLSDMGCPKCGVAYSGGKRVERKKP